MRTLTVPLIVVGAACIAIDATAQVAPVKAVDIGQSAPDFVANDIDGRKVALSDYRGKVVLLDFWATWCGPCRAEMPNVKKIYAKYKGKNFAMIGISLDTSKAKLAEFLAENRIEWVQVFDGKGWRSEVARLYGVRGIPAMFLLDQKGTIIGKKLRGPRLEAAVDQAVSGSGPSIARQEPQEPPGDVLLRETDASAKVKSLNRETVRLWKEKNYGLALQTAQHAAELAEKELGAHSPGLASALWNIGTQHREMENYAEAATYFKRAAEVHAACGNIKKQMHSLRQVGSALHKQGNHLQAVMYFNQALAKARDLRDKGYEAYLLSCAIGETYSENIKDDAKAIESFELALAIRQEMEDKKGEAHVLRHFGDYYRCRSDYDRAIDSYEQSADIYKSARAPGKAAYILRDRIAAVYRDQLRQYPSALDALEQALALYQEIQDQDNEKKALFLIAELHKLMED